MKHSLASWRRVATQVNQSASLRHVSTLITPLPGHNWTWTRKDRKEWKQVDTNDQHQKFYDYWRRSPYIFSSTQQFPYRLSLGGPGITPPIQPFDTSGSEIVVTEPYHKMYFRLLYLRQTRKVGSGAVLTGQPGIGASSAGFSPQQQLIKISAIQENHFFSISCSHGFFQPISLSSCLRSL